jgi:phosphoglycolate phosphatase
LRLVLFDIDGTLVSDGGAAREAYAFALEKVYGYRTDLRRYDFSGRTDPQITHMVLGDAGLPADEIDAAMPSLWEHYLAALERVAPGRVRVLPGVLALLETLTEDERVMLGLLTGNIEAGARVKLTNAAGRRTLASLNDFFPFGAFGSDSPRREELPPIAVERASRLNGHRFEGRDVVIIGDSIYDVRCGVPHLATTIAVASGKTAAETLLTENPDHFFASAEDHDALLAAIIG